MLSASATATDPPICIQPVEPRPPAQGLRIRMVVGRSLHQVAQLATPIRQVRIGQRALLAQSLAQKVQSHGPVLGGPGEIEHGAWLRRSLAGDRPRVHPPHRAHGSQPPRPPTAASPGEMDRSHGQAPLPGDTRSCISRYAFSIGMGVRSAHRSANRCWVAKNVRSGTTEITRRRDVPPISARHCRLRQCHVSPTPRAASAASISSRCSARWLARTALTGLAGSAG